MIEKLEFIIALARERHFGHAAEACGVSQPTLSAGIKQLEDSFGVLLVQRGSRFQGFTPEGERVLDWARRIVGDTRAMHQEIDALKHGLTGHIRIAAIPTALAMTAILTTPYRAKHPDVSFTILSRNSIEVLGLLENLEVDAGLTYLDNEPLGRVQTVPLYSEEYRLLISSDSPLGNRDSVTWAEVGKVPLCLLSRDMQNRRIIEGLLREAGAEVSPTLEIGLDHRPVRPCAYRAMGERDAGQARRGARSDRYGAGDPHRRAGGDPFDRARGPPAQSADAADPCAGQRSEAARADPGRRRAAADRRPPRQAQNADCPARRLAPPGAHVGTMSPWFSSKFFADRGHTGVTIRNTDRAIGYCN